MQGGMCWPPGFWTPCWTQCWTQCGHSAKCEKAEIVRSGFVMMLTVRCCVMASKPSPGWGTTLQRSFSWGCWGHTALFQLLGSRDKFWQNPGLNPGGRHKGCEAHRGEVIHCGEALPWLLGMHCLLPARREQGRHGLQHASTQRLNGG